MILACPRCRDPLERVARRLVCPTGHSYDVAREGYVHLLPPGVRVTGADTAEMLVARGAFLELGHYDALTDRLAAVITTGRRANARLEVLDAGCGEGYHLRRLGRLLADGGAVATARSGVDLAREAVRRAARRDPDGTYAVGTVYDLPVLDAAADVVLSIFAHRSFPELARVLRPGGLLLVVTPGPGHLRQLRAVLGRDGPESSPRLYDDRHGGPLAHVDTEHLAFTMRLDTSAQLVDLFRMTPYRLQASPGDEDRVRSADDLAVDVAFALHVFRR